MESEKLKSLIQNPELLAHETVDDLKQLTEKFPWFQLGWIFYLKNLKQTESNEFGEILKKVAVLVPDRKLLYNFINTESQKKSEKTEVEHILGEYDENMDETEVNKGNTLIDKFLMSEPGVFRRMQGNETANENENRIDIEEKSVAENDELISETLAEIYFQQKNFKKAINSYQKLSLKYPEKSIYFAARIEEIEKLKNYNSE